MDVLKNHTKLFWIIPKIILAFTYKHDLTYLKCKKIYKYKTRDVVTVEWVFL